MYATHSKLSFIQNQAAALIAGCMLISLVSLVLLCASCEREKTVITGAENIEKALVTFGDDGAFPFESEDPASGILYTGMLYTTEHEFCEKLCKEQRKVCRTSLKLNHLVSIKEKTEDPLIKAVDEPYISVENALEDIGNSQIVELDL